MQKIFLTLLSITSLSAFAIFEAKAQEFSPYEHWSEPCSQELIASLRRDKGKIELCVVTQYLFPEEEGASHNLFLVENYQEPHFDGDALQGITASIWLLREADDAYVLSQDFPVYQESQLGDLLLPFYDQAAEVKYLFRDFDAKGRPHYAIRVGFEGGSALIIKGRNEDASALVPLGHYEEGRRSDYFFGTQERRMDVFFDTILISQDWGRDYFQTDENGNFQRERRVYRLRDDLLADVNGLGSIDEENIVTVYDLFEEVDHALELAWDGELMEALAGVMNHLMELEPNYFIFENFHDQFANPERKALFDAAMEAHLTAENFSRYLEDAEIVLRVMREGNG